MPIENYDIVGSYNNQRVTPLDGERTINMFEYIDQLGKKPKALINTSGLINTNITFGAATGGWRAEFRYKNDQYGVIGNSVFKITAANVVSFLGNITTITGYVGVDANTFQVAFVDGTFGYIWDSNANTFTKITDTSFPTQPLDICYLDGFFVCIKGSTNEFELSSFEQGLVWGPDSQLFTASSVTSLLTMGSTANYQTGTSFTLSSSIKNISTFTVDPTTDIFTVASTTNFAPTGTPVTVINTGGLLPVPLKADTAYYTIIIDGTTFRLATSLANATAGTYIDITTAGTGTNNIVSADLPLPLNAADTYYAINVSPTTIKVATSYANAIAGTFITLTSNGTAPMTITSLGQLQLGKVTSHPGTLVACRTLHRRLFLFSQFFTEVWENAGIGTNLPFRRNNSLLMEYGCAAIGSVYVGFDIMIFLSQDRDGLGPVMLVAGTQAQPISNRALDFQLSQYAATTKVDDCRGFLLRENGLVFYRMNFTSSNHTFVYNVSLSDPSKEEGRLWHEEEIITGDRHPAQTHVFLNGLNYVGHYNQPTLYLLDSQTYTNDGIQIRRARIARPIVPPGYQRIRCDRFQLDLLQGQYVTQTVPMGEEDLWTETGFNIDTESGLDLLLEQSDLAITPYNKTPIVFLSLSKDGGQTYGYLQRAPMGAVGQRAFRTLWRKLGTTKRGQAFLPMIEFYDPVPFVILGASWFYEILPE